MRAKGRDPSDALRDKAKGFAQKIVRSLSVRDVRMLQRILRDDWAAGGLLDGLEARVDAAVENFDRAERA